jgi:hypothetical protein
VYGKDDQKHLRRQIRHLGSAQVHLRALAPDLVPLWQQAALHLLQDAEAAMQLDEALTWVAELDLSRVGAPYRSACGCVAIALPFSSSSCLARHQKVQITGFAYVHAAIQARQYYHSLIRGSRARRQPPAYARESGVCRSSGGCGR